MKTMIILLVVLLIMSSIYPCTGFIASNNKQVLVGNNEDYSETDFFIQFFPGDNEKYGRMYIGYKHDDVNLFPFCGLNEKGLFIDGFTVPPKNMTKTDKPEFSKIMEHEIIEKCSNVQEAIELFEKHDRSFLNQYHYQIFIADKLGDAATIECDEIIRKKDDYFIVTNFFKSNPQLGGYPCPRYEIAENMLKENDVSIEQFKNILSAVHMEDRYSTQYSNIFDLTNGIMYLYHFHNYETVVTFNLQEELQKGIREIFLPDLFPEKFRFNHYSESRNSQNDEITLNNLGYSLINLGLLENAIAIFEENVKRYPSSCNVYDSLGEAYFRNGNKKKAIINYKKVLYVIETNTELSESEKKFYKNNAENQIRNIEDSN